MLFLILKYRICCFIPLKISKKALYALIFCDDKYIKDGIVKLVAFFAVDFIKDGCNWCCSEGNIYNKCVKPFEDILSYIGQPSNLIGINKMKTVITWIIIFTALFISLIEAFYGNPNRIIFYVGIMALMWITDWFQKTK